MLTEQAGKAERQNEVFDHPAPQKFHVVTVAAVIAVIFCSIASTLRELQFANGSENLVVATALEMRRTGAWLVPTLQGEIRAAKPPLAAWIAAAAIRSQTLQDLSSNDKTIRDAAAAKLAWEARWPSLACACASLLAVYGVGRIAADSTTGLVAMLIRSTTLMFLRFGRIATTDGQLMLWVNVANLGLAYAAFVRSSVWVVVASSAALGLAFMSKGPVAIVQTILPIAVWWISFNRQSQRLQNGGSKLVRRLFAAVLSFTAVAFPWYGWVAYHSPAVWGRWFTEVTREGASGLAQSPLFAYAVFLPLMLPWSMFLIVGGWRI